MKKHRYCQWTDTSGYRRDGGSYFTRFIKMNITYETITHSIDSNINDHRTRLDHLTPNHFRNANRSYQDISSATDLLKVFRTAMSKRYRRICRLWSATPVALGEHHRHRFTYDIAPTDNHDMLACDGDLVTMQ